MNKNAQLKIQEMTFVLLAIIFLFAIILLMYTAWQSMELKSLNSKTREARATTILEVIAALPELRCSTSFSTTSEAVCLDKDKVSIFNNKSSFQDRYSILWQNAQIDSIEVQEVYPPTRKSYRLYKSNNLNASTRTFSTYTSLCSEEAGSQTARCTIAKIKVSMNMP